MGNGMGGIENEGRAVTAVGEVALSDGWAVYMGDGTYVVGQDDDRGEGQSVVLNTADLLAMLEHGPAGDMPPASA